MNATSRRRTPIAITLCVAILSVACCHDDGLASGARSADGPATRAASGGADTTRHQRIAAAIDSALAQRGASHVALVYRDEDPDDTVEVDATRDFHAASLMKVPVMIELFREARAGSFALDDEMPVVNAFQSIVDRSVFRLKAEDDSDADLYTRVGATMKIRDLCRRMITKSSNLATNLLIGMVTTSAVNATLKSMGAGGMRVLRGVEDQKAFDLGLNNTTTAHDMGAVMAALATGTAGDADDCRAMLEILTAQEFNEQIPAGLPPGTRVAHKTGQITHVLHDAAVIYPDGGSPFVLVILTEGFESEASAASFTAKLSRAIWAAR